MTRIEVEGHHADLKLTTEDIENIIIFLRSQLQNSSSESFKFYKMFLKHK